MRQLGVHGSVSVMHLVQMVQEEIQQVDKIPLVDPSSINGSYIPIVAKWYCNMYGGTRITVKTYIVITSSCIIASYV